MVMRQGVTTVTLVVPQDGRSTGANKSTVQRVWTQLRLKPHQLDCYMASNDPQFEEKAADIIGLYLHPPQHAAVFCVDERRPFRLCTGWIRSCR